MKTFVTKVFYGEAGFGYYAPCIKIINNLTVMDDQYGKLNYSESFDAENEVKELKETQEANKNCCPAPDPNILFVKNYC